MVFETSWEGWLSGLPLTYRRSTHETGKSFSSLKRSFLPLCSPSKAAQILNFFAKAFRGRRRRRGMVCGIEILKKLYHRGKDRRRKGEFRQALLAYLQSSRKNFCLLHHIFSEFVVYSLEIVRMRKKSFAHAGRPPVFPVQEFGHLLRSFSIAYHLLQTRMITLYVYHKKWPQFECRITLLLGNAFEPQIPTFVLYWSNQVAFSCARENVRTISCWSFRSTKWQKACRAIWSKSTKAQKNKLNGFGQIIFPYMQGVSRFEAS